MSRAPSGPTVRALEDAISSLADACGLDYLLRQVFHELPGVDDELDAIADVLRDAVNRSRKRADALAAADREAT